MPRLQVAKLCQGPPPKKGAMRGWCKQNAEHPGRPKKNFHFYITHSRTYVILSLKKQGAGVALWRSFRDSAVSTFGRGDDVEIEEYLPKTGRKGLFSGSPTTAAAVLAWLIYAMFILVLIFNLRRSRAGLGNASFCCCFCFCCCCC